MNFISGFFSSSTAPDDLNLQKLMLAGAMYVEENSILSQIHDNVDEDSTEEELIAVLVEGFCSLDMNAGETPSEDVLELLSDAWDIESKNDLLLTLEGLLSGRHQNILSDIVSKNSTQILSVEKFRTQTEFSSSFEDLDDKSFVALVNRCKTINAEAKLGIIGWDWARYVHLLRLSFLADMLQQDEAWTHLKRLEKPLKNRFSNWESFGNSYMSGRDLWMGSDNSFGDVMVSLNTDPWSPWKKIGWF